MYNASVVSGFGRYAKSQQIMINNKKPNYATPKLDPQDLSPLKSAKPAKALSVGYKDQAVNSAGGTQSDLAKSVGSTGGSKKKNIAGSDSPRSEASGNGQPWRLELVSVNLNDRMAFEQFLNTMENSLRH